ncbi:uncharacterized protein LOC135479551 isoform X2 [Liolophura sinensis]
MPGIRSDNCIIKQMETVQDKPDGSIDSNSAQMIGQDAVHQYSQSVQNELLCQRSQNSLPLDDTEAEQPPTLRRQRKLETPADLDTNSPRHVCTCHVERGQQGHCSRESIEYQLFRQDSRFDLNPQLGDHPLLRCHPDPSLDGSPSTDSTDTITGLVQKLKDMLFTKDNDLRSLEKCDSVRLGVQKSTGYEPFGCDLHSYKDPNRNRWFHLLKYPGINQDNTVARELGIEENDEILMINKEVVTRVNQQQVKMKISRTLKSGNVTLLLRRLVEGEMFEYLEIQAKVEVIEGTIRASRTSIVYSTAKGSYLVLRKEEVESKQINIFHRDNVVCWSGDELVTEVRPPEEYTFERFIVEAYHLSTGHIHFFYVLKCGDRYAESGENGVKLKPAGSGWSPRNVDSRFFRVHVIETGSPRKIVLECAEKQNYYLACKNGRVEFIQANHPADARDFTVLKEVERGSL